jgi:protein-S-isoprenylcysteine O-methyltransferase Ste14
MLLKDRLVSIGHLFFRYRGYQFLIYLLVIIIGIKHLSMVKDNHLYEISCFYVALLGMLIRALTVGYVSIGTSGRNCHEQEAFELNTTGMYSIVRNPLYIGNFFIFLGIVMLVQDLKLILLSCLLYWLFYDLIILTEEDFLLNKFKDQYVKYANEVNCLIPSFKNYKKPDKQFSPHMVLMREHDTLLTTVLAFIGMEIIMETMELGRLHLDLFWIIVLIITFIIFCILKYIKKYRVRISSIIYKTSPI